MEYILTEGDCLDLLPSLPDQSIDLVLTDPPYPEIDRDYGRLTEAAWHILMDGVIAECKRVLKPTGSAVFIVQPNSRHVGEMRLWVWEFLVRTAKAWNLIQDVYWWNPARCPTVHCQRKNGLMRPSVKACLWFGLPSCYRNQDEVLWLPSDDTLADKRTSRALKYMPGGNSVRHGRLLGAFKERGGVTPFNLIPLANTDSQSSSGAKGHGAGTPYKLCEWWVKYASPPGGKVLDCFAGASTVGLAAIKNGREFVGFEKEAGYVEVSRERLNAALLP